MSMIATNMVVRMLNMACVCKREFKLYTHLVAYRTLPLLKTISGSQDNSSIMSKRRQYQSIPGAEHDLREFVLHHGANRLHIGPVHY